MPPDYYYRNNWHDDTTQYSHAAWYALKHFDFDDSGDVAKIDSFVRAKYPEEPKEGHNVIFCAIFFEYSSKSNENTVHSLSSDRSLEIEIGRKMLAKYCYDYRDENPQWSRMLYKELD